MHCAVMPYVLLCVTQVVSGLLPYLSDDKVEAIFTQSRLMVDGSPTSPSHLLSQRETLSYISHWHEPAVREITVKYRCNVM